MREAVLFELGNIKVIDSPIPKISTSTDVLVKVKAVGICGTDLHMFKEKRGDVQLPRIMGHELSGEVIETGNDVNRIKVNDKVVLDPVFACDNCNTCKKGYPNVCSNVKCYGVQMDGGFRDYIVVDQKNLHTFSSSISFENAAIAEPFSIASNILNRVDLRVGEKILIIGCGTIGLSVLQVAKTLGAEVMMADISEKKLELAKTLGANATVVSKDDLLKQAISKFAPEGFEVVLDAVGITSLFEKSIEYTAPRGRIASIGFDSKPANISPIIITKKELSIIGSRMNCNRFPIVLQWLNEGKLNAECMISAKYSIDDIQKAFIDTLNNSETNVKTLIIMD